VIMKADLLLARQEDALAALKPVKLDPLKHGSDFARVVLMALIGTVVQLPKERT